MAAVTVKVPNHLELVSKAVNAGKHVYCEWPLGRNLEEAEELQRLVQERGVHAVIGTQALRAPAVRYLKQLIADGYVGRVLSICLIGSGGLGGAEVDAANAYTVEASAGASLLTIPFGHTMAALIDIFGELTSVHANLVTRQTSVKMIGTDKVLTATAPDQVVVQGVFQQEIPFSAHYRGGTNPGTGLLLEIVGTEGTFRSRVLCATCSLCPSR